MNVTMEMNEIYERLDHRRRTCGRTLDRAFRCEPEAWAVVEAVAATHDLEPRQMITDVELAFEKAYWPTLEKQLAVEADYVPAISLIHGVVLLAAAFGAEVHFEKGQWPWARPCLRSIGQVDHLTVPNLETSPPVRHFLDQVRWLQERTNHCIPIKRLDIQSPFTTACQMRHYEDLLTDLYEDPVRTKKLLDIITETSLQFLRLQERVYTCPAYPGPNFPNGSANLGIEIADDTALIPLSPEIYEEFCLPTIRQIAREVPGIFVHCCGDYTHQINNLRTLPNLRAVQVHSGPGEMDPLPAWRKLRGRVCLYSDTNAISLGDQYRGRYWECLETYVLPRLLEDRADGLVVLAPPADTLEDRTENVRRLKSLITSMLKRIDS